jgi:NADPH:quinone reductase-like Zn-dependent oxidoreductase
MPGEVRVRVRAAGLNFAELMARLGLYPDAPKPPCVLGYEIAGEVDAVGDGVTEFKKGSRVLAMTRFGGHADCVCVPGTNAVALPDNATFEEAAAIPVNYLTAYHMLFNVGGLTSGQSVLVHMAAGGVGIAALQLCKTIPQVTTFGTASRKKHEAVVAQGCDHPIDYRLSDYSKEVKKLTGQKGVNIILDALGGADWVKGYELLRPSGKLIAFGFANMSVGEKRNLFNVVKQLWSVPKFSPLSLMNENRSVCGVNLGRLWSEVDLMRQSLQSVVDLFALGKIKPQVDSVFPFRQAAEAHKRMHSRENIGKIVLVP